MDPRHYHWLYSPGYDDFEFLGSHVGDLPSGRHLNDPTYYQTIALDPTAMLPTQYTSTCAILDSPHQITAPFSMIPSIDSVSTRPSEGSHSLVIAQPQVSPAVALTVDVLA